MNLSERVCTRPRIFGDDVWLRAGIAALLAEGGWAPSVVSGLRGLADAGGVYLPLAPVPVICHLPAGLGPLMTTLRALCRCLTADRFIRHHVVLLTAAPESWVRGTMVNLLVHHPVNHTLAVLPEKATAQMLLQTVNGYGQPGRPDDNPAAGLSPLSPAEVCMLSDLLARRFSIAEIARSQDVPESWVRRVLRKALRKTGVRSVRRLLTWHPGLPGMTAGRRQG